MYFIAAIACLAAAIFIEILVKKRDFNKTNQAGVQEFDSFGASYRHGLAQRSLKALAKVMMIGFAIFLIVAFAQR